MESNKKIFISLFAPFLLMVFVLIRPVTALANEVLICDYAGLINTGETAELKESMMELAVYGDVLFYSCHSKEAGTPKNAQSAIMREFPKSSSAAAFYIDMDNRLLTVYVYGSIADMISKGKCETIADNVYKLASKSEYSNAAIKAYNQMFKVCKGLKIDNSMQMASNICLALVISILINYGLVKLLHSNRKKKTIQMLEETGSYVWFRDLDAEFRDSSRRYSPRQKRGSRSYGGGGFSGGFGGGFGGGHGGSHHF